MNTTRLSAFCYVLLFIGLTCLACKSSQKIPPVFNDLQYLPESDITIPTVDTIEIAGTLRYAGKDKLVIIIAGSGPTDRNCNGPGFTSDAFKLMADTLFQLGISTYRYDKRGIGESTKVGEEHCTLYDRIEDVKAISRHFSSQFSELYLYGHSEGALVATVASRASQITGCIIASGTSVTIDEIILQQTAQYTKLTPILEKHFDEMRTGSPLSEVHPIAQSLIRPSLVPYYKSAMELDPTSEIAKLNKRALIIGGHCDIQVPVSHAEMLHNAAPQSELVLIDAMGHVMKQLEGDCSNARTAYADASMAIHPALISNITAFLNRE